MHHAATTMDEHTVNRGALPPYPVIYCCCPHELEEFGDRSHGGHVMKTSIECGGDLLCNQQQDVLGPDLPLKMANGGRMLPRSPSHDKDFATCVRTNAAVAAITAQQQQQQQQQQQPFATTAVILNRVSNSFPEAFFKRKSQDLTNSVWFDEDNDLIKSWGALQSALGLAKSFSTSDIADVTSLDSGSPWLEDNEDNCMPYSASELAVDKLGFDPDVLLMPSNMRGKLGNTSRSLSTCVVVGDMASMSQLPSPNRYSSSLQNSNKPSSFNSTDLVRSVNKKVRRNYIQRRLLLTYKTLEHLTQSAFNLNKLSGNGLDQQSSTGNVGSSKYLCVPKSCSTTPSPDDIAVCADTIKRFQPKTFNRYDTNMSIVNWLDKINLQNTEKTED